MAEIDLMGLLQGKVGTVRSELADTAAPVEGVTIGIVTSLDDRQGLGRVKVRLPLLADRVSTTWARVASPWAGQRRGSYLLPEVDDEVLVAFRHNNPAYPYIIGCLWNDKDRPPEASPTRNQRSSAARRAISWSSTTATEQSRSASAVRAGSRSPWTMGPERSESMPASRALASVLSSTSTATRSR